MKNRLLPFIGLITLSIFIIIILYATQAFSTVYYKKGILMGSLAGAYSGSRYAFYVFGTFFFITTIAITAYLVLSRKNYGIHNKSAFDLIKTFIISSLVIFVVMIISFTKTDPSSMAILSWIVFAVGLIEVIMLGLFTNKIYRT